MNTLSWIIYLADVATGLNHVLVSIILFLIVSIGFISFVNTLSEGDIFKEFPATVRFFKIGLVCLPILGVLCSIIPSKKTIFAIAASEFGEKLAQTEQAQDLTNDATKALRQWIKKQIEETTK